MAADGSHGSRSARAIYYVDDQGEMWPRDSAELSRQLGTRLRGGALEDFLVRQSGFALVRLTGALVECVFDPEVVSPSALVGLLYVIGENGHLPVAIRSPADPIRVDMLCDRRRAIAQVSQLIELKRQRPRFDRRPCVIEKTSYARLWMAAGEVVRAPLGAASRDRILDSLFNGNYTLNELCEADGRYRILSIGSRIAGFDPDFAKRGIGETYRALSDARYGAWVADTFDEYTRLQSEQTEVIDALVEVPGQPSRRLAYTRLVLPTSCDARRLLLIATDVA